VHRIVVSLAVLALSPVLYLFGCSEGPIPLAPSTAKINRLERRLARHPCVGSLDRWERNYTHKSEPFLLDYLGRIGEDGWQLARWYDYRTIDFDLREPGITAPSDWGIEKSSVGRRVHAMIPRYQGAILGDQGAAGDAVSGTYQPGSDRLHMWWACGRFRGFAPSGR
jgi:hypothetical protein